MSLSFGLRIKSMLTRRWAWLAAFFALSFWAAAYLVNDRWRFGSETLLHAAAAVIIALLIAILVEQPSRRSLEASEENIKQRIDLLDKAARDRVSIIEKMALERLNKERDEFENQLKQLAISSVAGIGRAVFGTLHSGDVIEETIRSVFSETLLRENYEEELIFMPVEGNTSAVRIINITKYVVFNPSLVREEIFSPKFSSDDTAILYPNNTDFYSPKLTNFSIDGVQLSDEQLVGLEVYNERQSNNNELDYNTVNLGKCNIPPQGRIHVSLSYEHVESADGEWTSTLFLPTKGVIIRVRNEIGVDMKVFLGSLFRENFGKVEYLNKERSFWERRYDGVVLPYSGWVLRWNRT